MKTRLPAIVALAILFLYFASNYSKQSPRAEIDFTAFGKTPVHLNGRVQPLDSVARNTLLSIRYKRSFLDESGRKTPAIVWLSELMMAPHLAHDRPVFKIQDEDIRSLIKLPEKPSKRSQLMIALLGKGSDHFYYSFNELLPHLKTISEQAQKASELETQQRSRFQKAIIHLARGLSAYSSLSQTLHHGQVLSFASELKELATFMPNGVEAVNKRQQGQEFDEDAFNQIMNVGRLYQNFEQTARFFTVPTKGTDGEIKWEKNSYALRQIIQNGEAGPIIQRYAAIVDAYRNNTPESFNQNVQELHAALKAADPEAFRTAGVEQQFNFLDPFYISMVGYVMAFLCVLFYWARSSEKMNQASLWLISACAILHTLGILFRIYIIGYAPIINLYSSAIGVGWGGVLLAIGLERIFKNGIGNACAAIIGFSTLLVAHHLSADGDTLEMLRAVLDNNFWLATHVTIITLGYSATFLAGAIGFIFILMSIFTDKVDRKSAKSMGSMVYGILCFAILFSFIGTILGGIWADQSWGRFWGWDPKENGALLIVIWNAIILHARWGGFVKVRGIMMMAIFGNVVFSWSWFGTNMLGIGLHAYGFMDEAFFYLAAFVLSQILVIGLGAIPPKHWKSQI